MTIDEMKNKISMALKDPILQQGFEIICKENAELKDNLLQDRETYWGKGVKYAEKKYLSQLTQAKKILKSLVDDLEVIDGEQTKELDSVKEAEQFLKEIEEMQE